MSVTDVNHDTPERRVLMFATQALIDYAQLQQGTVAEAIFDGSMAQLKRAVDEAWKERRKDA